MRIIVYGQPAPQGSKRFVGISKKTGHGVMIESSSGVKPWRQDVVAAARAVMDAHGHTMLDGPLRVRMVFTLPKPASAPKRRVTHPDKKPDLSKLIRSTEDALTTAGVWRDDARVVEYERTAKVYPGEDAESLASPGCLIVINKLGE